MALSRAARLVLAAGSVAVSLVTSVPGAHAGPPVVFSSTGVALGVGDVVAYGTPAGDDLCSFQGGDYRVKGNGISVSTTVTEQCTLVISAIEQAAERAGLPDGPVTPKQPRDTGSALPSTRLTETAGALPHPDRYAGRMGWVENIVRDEAGIAVFSARDTVTFTRNLTTGEIGAPTYRFDESWCRGMPYVRAESPATNLQLPFRHTVTECTYEFTETDPDSLILVSYAGYRQSAPMPGRLVYERARFTVKNHFYAFPDTDFDLRNDHRHSCPVVSGQLPEHWVVDCASEEDSYEQPR